MRSRQPNRVLFVGTLISIAVVTLALAALVRAESSGGEIGLAVLSNPVDLLARHKKQNPGI